MDLELDPAWSIYPADRVAAVPLVVRPRVLSPQLRNYRDLIVALPPSYPGSTARYPVVYMQDGQNLFDPATSYAGAWHLRDTLGDLATRGVEAIVVGIPNAGNQRLYEYSPFRDPVRGGGGGDRYLAFVVETVKPLIDAAFRTRPDRASTIVAGSSMGGLISAYALYRLPDVVGAAGAHSPSIWFAERRLLDYLGDRADLGTGRIYFDIGLHEPEGAIADVRALRDLLLAAGRVEGRDFRYVEDEGGLHDETAWGRRVGISLPFLVGPDAPTG